MESAARVVPVRALPGDRHQPKRVIEISRNTQVATVAADVSAESVDTAAVVAGLGGGHCAGWATREIDPLAT